MRGEYIYKTFFTTIIFILVTCTFSYAWQSPEINEGEKLTPLELHVHSLIEYVEKNERTVDNLTEENLADLPIGIARKINDITYIIAIDSAYSDEQGWFLSAYASLQFPGAQRKIAFSGKNIAFNKGGIAITQSSRLVLASPQTIDISENVDLVLPADGQNYLEFDCSGFKSVNLKGQFFFNDDLLIADNTLSNGTNKVTATFEINATDLNNIKIQTSISPFQVKGLEGVTFQVKNAVVDLSDYENPDGFIFPKDYQNSYGADIELWRGFYLQEVNVLLPKELDSKQGRTSIQGKKILIDDLGISGLFSGNNLISSKNGSADGWPFSVNRLSMQLTANHLTGGGFAGVMNVPFLGEDSLGYSADILQNEKGGMDYLFSVTTSDDKEFKVPFAGTVHLNKGCIIKIENREGKFIPSAVLNGKLTVNQKILQVKNIEFEKLVLTTEKPFLVSGVFSLTGDGQGKTSGFPVSIEKVTLEIYQGKLSIGMGIGLNLMGEKDKSFKASTYVRVMVENEETVTMVGEQKFKKHKWKLDKIKIEQVKIACSTQAFALNGVLDVYQDDPVYGDGFHGAISFAIRKVLEKGIRVNAYFGNKDDYRYFHMDAFVPVGKIPIYPSVLYITGIMGGFSYHMVRQNDFKPDFNELSADVKNVAEDAPLNAPSPPENHLVYKPDKDAGLGFLAGVTLMVIENSTFNGDAIFEVQLNTNGGLKYIQFNGAGYFFTPPSERPRGQSVTNGAAVCAKVSMLFDNDNDMFHANMKTYINLMGAIKGTGPDGLVGEAVMHFDKNDWYIYIGRPRQMLGVDVLGLVSVQTYFMVGSKIESLPPLPREVTDLFEGKDLNFMRNENTLSPGKGFAMGLHFKVGFNGELTPFYAIFSAGGGTDVMLREYKDRCANRQGPIGINGWFASGQAYLFLNGDVGINFKGKKFAVMKLGGAAFLQAKLPNPSWMTGGIAGKYAILGGLVKGKFNLTFVVGEQCELIRNGNELGDIEVISDIKPGNGGESVNVFTAPQVSFNVSIDKELSMMNDENETNTYRVKLDEFKLFKGTEELTGEIRWNSQNDVVSIKTREILPPKADMRIVVKVHFEKKLPGGAWEALLEDGKVDYELKEAKFITGEAPDNIAKENIEYNYPVTHQYNFYKDEYNKGYVKLLWDQGYLFKPKDSLVSYSYVARFKSSSGKIIESPIGYDSQNTTVQFNFPSGLTKETIYALNFVKIPLASADLNQNVNRSENESGADTANTVSINETSLNGALAQQVEKVLYESDFRTSQFSTFSEKINSLSSLENEFDIAMGNIAVIGKKAYSTETFDKTELEGSEGQTQLIQLEASVDNIWFKETINPLLYEKYPTAPDITIEWRKPLEKLGVAPLKAVRLENLDNSNGYLLEEDQLRSGYAPSKSGNILIGYYLSYYSFWDYSELLNKAAKKYITSSSSATEGAKRLLETKGYTDLGKGHYPVKLTYVLPGNKQISESKEIRIKF